MSASIAIQVVPKVAVRCGAPKVSAYIKVVYRPDGDILTIEQKTSKYQ